MALLNVFLESGQLYKNICKRINDMRIGDMRIRGTGADTLFMLLYIEALYLRIFMSKPMIQNLNSESAVIAHSNCL